MSTELLQSRAPAISDADTHPIVNNHNINNTDDNINSANTTEDENELTQLNTDTPTTHKPKHKRRHRCRICLSSKQNNRLGQLIRPCKCIGSMKYIHYSCIQQWRRLSKNVCSYIQCESCCSLYNNLPDISIKTSVIDYWLNNVQLLYNAHDKLYVNNRNTNINIQLNNQSVQTIHHDNQQYMQHNLLMEQYYTIDYPVIHYSIDIQIAQRLLYRQQNELSNYNNSSNTLLHHPIRHIHIKLHWCIYKLFLILSCAFNVLIIPLVVMFIAMLIDYQLQESVDIIKHVTFALQLSLFTLVCIPLSSFIKYICNVVFQQEEAFT